VVETVLFVYYSSINLRHNINKNTAHFTSGVASIGGDTSTS
jgi:hypothetical protein